LSLDSRFTLLSGRLLRTRTLGFWAIQNGDLDPEIPNLRLENKPATAITATQEFPAFSQTATAAALVTATATQELPAFGQTATAAVLNTLAATQELPALDQVAIAIVVTGASVQANQQLPAFDQVVTGIVSGYPIGFKITNIKGAARISARASGAPAMSSRLSGSTRMNVRTGSR
jgi:hypothetical protein